MKKIPLTQRNFQGKYAIVDDADFEWLNQWKWTHAHGYAIRYHGSRENQKKIVMHRAIMNTPKDMETDHINMNRLDNRRVNLRICTRSQNMMNCPVRSHNKSGYKGVSYLIFNTKGYKLKKPWMARIGTNDKQIFLGYFKSAKEAARAYDKVATCYQGEFARPNFSK